MSFRTGQQNREERLGNVGVLFMDEVGDIILPTDSLFHAYPAHGELAVGEAGEQLGCGDEACNEECRDGGIDAQGDGGGGNGEADEDGELVVPAEPGETEKEAGPGGGAEWMKRRSCGEKEAENKGCPDEAADHLRPVV